MAFATPVLRVVASGTAWGGKEIWSCSWTMIPNFDATPSQPTNLAPWRDAIAAWVGRSESRISSTVKHDLTKVNMLGTDGKYVNKSETFFVEHVGSYQGGMTNAQPLPPQCTAAVTLTTARARGRASRGRFFPPGLVTAVGLNDGLMPVDHTQAMANSAAILLRALNDISPNWRVGVASEVSAGQNSIVTGVQVGRVVDTQRRRRAAILEGPVKHDPTFAVLPAGG